ncbi:MAG TPA: extracellular solute-binding protein [Magnetospirillaceae bacterium]|nr:extracellular solute-binding protein [Magnetospirillaceae bacterium]
MKKIKARAILALTAALCAALGASAQAKPVEIDLWITGTASEAGPPPADWDGFRIVRETLGIDMKLSLLPTSFTDQDTKVVTAAAANRLPDILHVNRDVFIKLVKQGLLAPVDDLMKKMPVRTKTHYHDPLRNKLAMYNGKMYGLPDPGKIPMTDGWVIRKDWLDRLGLQPPKTIEDFYAVARAFTRNDPDGNGRNDTYGLGAYIETSDITNWGLGVRFDPILGAYGVVGVWDVTNARNFGLNVRKPEYYDAMVFIARLNQDGLIDPDWTTLKKDEFRARWKQGKFGIMRENFAALSTVANYPAFDKNFPDGEWIPIPPPVGVGGKSSEGMLYVDTRIHVVSKRAVDAGKGDAIARLLEWFATDGYELVMFGQKGVNYTLDAEGNVSTAGLPDPEKSYAKSAMVPILQLRNLSSVNSDWELLPRYITHKTIKGRTIKPLEIWRYFTAQPWTEATAALLIEPPANKADFERFYTENLVKFALGQQTLTPAAWRQFLSGLDRLGARDLERTARAKVQEAGLLK